jgi:hypothetical protein
MSQPVEFLNAFAHALAIMTLYPEGHPSREKSIETAFDLLQSLTQSGTRPTFTFLDEEVVYGKDPLRELKAWEWGGRLVAAGIQRLEFERLLSRDEFENFLQEILARLMVTAIGTCAGQPPDPRVRRLRRAADQASVQGRVGIREGGRLPDRAKRNRVRPRRRERVRPDDAQRRGPGHRPQRRTSRAQVTLLEGARRRRDKKGRQSFDCRPLKSACRLRNFSIQRLL